MLADNIPYRTNKIKINNLKERIREEGEKKGRRREEERREKRKGKRIEAQGAKPRTPTPVIDALTGEEEQTGKKKREQRKKQGAGLQPSYP